MLLFALTFLLTCVLSLPNNRSEEVVTGNALKEPMVWFGMLGIALCVGVEVTIASFLILFLHEPGVLNVSLETAGRYSMMFWIGFLVGRLGGSLLLRRWGAIKVLQIHAVIGIGLAMIACLGKGIPAASAAICLGVCTSVMFPLIFSWVIGHCRTQRYQISGFLCMANIGGALIPPIQGLLADRMTLSFSFIVPMIGYILIVLYALVLRKMTMRSAYAPAS